MSGYIYNSIFVQHCKTLQFDMEQEFDSSGTDSVWNTYTIRVAGFVSTSGTAFRGDTAVVLAQIKSTLESPRRGLEYKIGDQVIVSVGDGFGQQLDANLGPKPTKASVRHVCAGTFYVECGCVVRLFECENLRTPNRVVSLRWSQTESYDQDWVTTLATRGKLIVRTDLRASADFFRPLATPPVPTGFIRTRSQYTLNPNGVELDFEFDDVEQDRMPTAEATAVAGSFTVHVDRGYFRKGEVEVTLRGPPGANRQNLAVRAIAVCYSKLGSEDPAPVAGRFPFHLMSGSVTFNLVQPVVTARMNCILAPLPIGPGPGALAAWFKNQGGITPGLAPGAWAVGVGGVPGVPFGIAPPTRKELAGLLTAAFRDPCILTPTAS
jgi:hypothetical protein